LGTQPKPCWTCNGKGKVQYRKGPEIRENECEKCEATGKIIKSKCGACKGKGTIMKISTEEIDIPGYLKNGGEITFKGKGHLCPKTNKKGNLILEIEVEESEIFERKGAHIFSEIEISFAEGIIGSSTTIDTIWGRRKVNFKGLKKVDHLMTLPKYGVYNYEKKVYGNHYIHAKLVPPKELTREMEELYEELKSLGM
jgi:molecular chaperone DnaJ